MSDVGVRAQDTRRLPLEPGVQLRGRPWLRKDGFGGDAFAGLAW